MSPLRQMAGSAYLVAAILILFPAVELVQDAWPVRLDEVVWRVTAVGALSRMILTPLLGLLLAFALALFLEQWRVVRTLAWVNVVLVVMLAGGLVIYGLDAARVRGDLARAAQHAYDLGIVISFAKYTLGGLVLAALLYSQARVLRTVRKQAARAAAEVLRGNAAKGDLPPLFFHSEGEGHVPSEADDSRRRRRT